MQEAGGQEGITVLPAFALIDADYPAVTFEVGELQLHDFPDAQARGLGRHEHHPMFGGGGAGAQALEFFDTPQVWQEPPSRAWGQVEAERLPAEGCDIEKLEPTGCLVTGTPREVAFDKSMV